MVSHLRRRVERYKAHEARPAAKAKQKNFDDMECSLSVEVIGDPYIIAGGTIYLKNFRPGMPTKWHVTKVTHKYDNSGFTSQVEADTKFSKGEGSASGSDTVAPTDASALTTQNPTQSDPESPYDEDNPAADDIEPAPLPGTEQ